MRDLLSEAPKCRECGIGNQYNSKSNDTHWFAYNTNKNKGERYSRVPRLSDTRYSAKGTKSRVPRLSDTRYSAKGTKGKLRYASRAILKCVTYPRSQYIPVGYVWGAAGSHPHYGQSPFAFIKAIQNF